MTTRRKRRPPSAKVALDAARRVVDGEPADSAYTPVEHEPRAPGAPYVEAPPEPAQHVPRFRPWWRR